MVTVREDVESEASSVACSLRAMRDLTQAGRFAQALAAAQALLERAPFQRNALYESAVNLRRLGRIEEAKQTLDALETRHPRYSLIFEERGLGLLALGDAAGALRCFERAVALNPALAASWEKLEQLWRAAGETDRAAVAAQHLAKLKQLPATIVEAGARFSDGDDAAAEAMLDKWVANEGRHVEALRLLARIAQRRGALARAESLFNETVERAPGYAAARLDLVRVLIERQKYPAALQAVDEALRRTPSDAETRFLRATSLAGLARHDEAVAIFRALIDAAPGNNPYWIVLGHSLKALGRAEEAISAYREATRGAAHVGDAYWSLANLKTYRFEAAEVERMRALEALAGAPDRAELCFALAKAMEDQAALAESWAFYTRGNALARARRRYRPEAIEDDARRLIDLCGAEFFAARAGVGDAARDPIFIVGLPRSGSTLLEQILASHRDVDGTQELHDVPRIVAELREQSRAGYPELLSELDPSLFARLGRRYLDEVGPYRRGRPRFLDKMPNNFWRVGLLHLMLPNARILDIRREPMSACVANFKQFYVRGQEFSYGLEEVAGYYRAYLDLTRHWRAALPGRVLTVLYEDLVEDLEASLRRILAYCELDFDPACLEFHLGRRVVNTPSSEQVRQPLFRDGIDQWTNYEPWLGPLKDALGDALARYR